MKINEKSRFSFALMRSRLFWFSLVLAVLFSLSLARYERFAAKRHFGDFHVYYLTGERLLAGSPIYVAETEIATPYKYSPLVASFFATLAFLPEPWAAGLWHILNLSFLFGSAFLCVRFWKTATRETEPLGFWESVRLAALCVLGISPTVLHCLNSGQVGLLILFLFVLGTYFLEREKETLGAFFFAWSAMFKYLPILIIPYFLFKKRIRFVFLFLFWFLFFHLLPSLWLGWERNLTYLKGFLPFLTSTTLDHISLLDFKNQSLWAYLYRLLFYDLGIFEIRNYPEWLVAFGMVIFLIFYAAILFSKSKGGNTFVIDSSLLSILVVLLNPNAWKHNFVILLFPFSVLLFQAFQYRWKNWRVLVLVLVAVLLLASNRDFVGWNVRFELMSVSVMLLASLLLFSSLILGKKKLP